MFSPQQDNAPWHSTKTTQEWPKENEKKNSMHQPGLQLSQISSRSSIPEKCLNNSNCWRPPLWILIHEHKSSRGVMCCLAPGCWRLMLYVYSAMRFHINGMCWKSDPWRLTGRPTGLRPVSMSSRIRPKSNPQLDLHLLDLSQCVPQMLHLIWICRIWKPDEPWALCQIPLAIPEQLMWRINVLLGGPLPEDMTVAMTGWTVGNCVWMSGVCQVGHVDDDQCNSLHLSVDLMLWLIGVKCLWHCLSSVNEMSSSHWLWSFSFTIE